MAALNDTLTSNLTSSPVSPISPVIPEAWAKPEVLILSIIFILIMIGNIPVVMTIFCGKLVRTRMYYFLLHLCFADLITGCFNVIPQLAWEITSHFYGGNFLCKLVKFLQILGPYLSSYTLTAMSIDRFLAICYPLSNNHQSLSRAKKSIAASWFAALLFCSPQAIFFSYQFVESNQGSGSMECWATFPLGTWGPRLYVTWYTISVFIIPFIVILVTNVRICWELWGSGRSLSSSSGNTATATPHPLSSTSNHPLSSSSNHPLSSSSRYLHHNNNIPISSEPPSSSLLPVTGNHRTSLRHSVSANVRHVTLCEQQPLIAGNQTDGDEKIRTIDGADKIRTIDGDNKIMTIDNEPDIIQVTSKSVPATPTTGDGNITFTGNTLTGDTLTGDSKLINGIQVTGDVTHQRSPLKVIIKNNLKSPSSFISSLHHSHSHRDSKSPTPGSISDFITSSSHPSHPLDTSSSSSNKRGTSLEHHHQDEEHRRAKVKSVKLTVTVICCYVFCSLPFITVQLWATWWPGAQETSAWTGPLVKAVMLLSSLNSCVNPWIYLTFNTRLYRACKRLFCCCFKKWSGHGSQSEASRFASEARSC